MKKMKTIGVVQILIVGILLINCFPLQVRGQPLALSGVVSMQERDVRVTVYYHPGDEVWAQNIFDTAVEALPILEELAGFPYSHRFNVEVYPKSDREMEGFGGKNLEERGIWINRDVYTPELIKYGSNTFVILHEMAHYWSDDEIYTKPWLKEGFCELFVFLVLMETDRKGQAFAKKNDWSLIASRNEALDFPLDQFEYESRGPQSNKIDLAYSKSALFCYEIYKTYGIETIQKINEYLYDNGIQADSLEYMNLLEDFTGEDQKEFFLGWIFPEDLDIKEWKNADDAITELEELVDRSFSHVKETYGFNAVTDFADFRLHILTEIAKARSCVRDYDFEKAVLICRDEIEETEAIFSEFDECAECYREAEEYYGSLDPMITRNIAKDKLVAARYRLLSFEFDLFTQKLEEFYRELETAEMYRDLYSDWCSNGECTLPVFEEVFSSKPRNEAIAFMGNMVAVMQDYESTAEDVAHTDPLTSLGIAVLGGKPDIISDLESAQEEIRSGNSDTAQSLLTAIEENLSRARMYGTGVVCVVLASMAGSLFFVWKKREAPPRKTQENL
ncbi:MAG: hypothetical protein HXS40_08250 [Theionarchaea archaeon]|nr:hypothetical protein [Theionarchaea archaeon]